MIKFKLKDRDEKTGVRTGVLKPNHKPFMTPQRTLLSTEVNYRYGIRNLAKDLDYPNELFLAQIKVDAKRLWNRESEYYNNLVKQSQRYLTTDVAKKTCIFKPLLGVYVNERQEDGRYKKKFKLLHKLNLELKDEMINKIIRSVVQVTDDADYDALSLPYIHNLFKLNKFKKNLKTAQRYSLNQLSSGIEIMPQLPHNDNIDDFDEALKTFQDENQDGIICIPSASNVRYRFTHNAVKDFSESDKSEKIGLMCIDAPRKHPSKIVSHPHYTLLQGYDLVARKITLPFLREEGKGSGEKEVEEIKRFNYKKLAIELFNKQFLFDTEQVDTSCPALKKYTNKELFREANKINALDTILKVMETFDSHKEMNDCQPYITSNDFGNYLKIRQSLKQAYKDDFSHRPQKLSKFF